MKYRKSLLDTLRKQSSRIYSYKPDCMFDYTHSHSFAETTSHMNTLTHALSQGLCKLLTFIDFSEKGFLWTLDDLLHQDSNYSQRHTHIHPNTPPYVQRHPRATQLLEKQSRLLNNIQWVKCFG